MYGALGSSQSLLPLMAIAQTVTAIGRADIMTTKGIAEKMFPDAKVVYGMCAKPCWLLFLYDGKRVLGF